MVVLTDKYAFTHRIKQKFNKVVNYTIPMYLDVS